MEQDKPFKTIEVIDSRTQQVCKVACLSCIRGHRTTSCGIPVCRSKIFWTVKRPGRPSNSCNCRFGAIGGCRCVVAKTACPHKSKKGEKRSGECRCDEQGRFCCLIEPQQWDVLMALGKPAVDFYQTREALEARFAVAAPTPYSMPVTPQTHHFVSVPSTPALSDGVQATQLASPLGRHQSPPAVLAPRFGMMGIGAPQGSEQNATPDMLSWDGQTPQAPREYRAMQYETPPMQEEESSCCQTPASSQQLMAQPQFTSPSHTPSLPQQHRFAPFNGLMTTIKMPQSAQQPLPPPPIAQPTFTLDKLNNDYFNYQFPSAICQTCGMSGCTCRSCPAVMQNFSNGSWAQCCGRKHARTAAYVAPAAEIAFAPQYEQQKMMDVVSQQHQQSLPVRNGHNSMNGLDAVQLAQGDLAPQDFYREQLLPNLSSYPQHPPQQGQHHPSLQSPTSIPDFTPFDPGEAFDMLENGGGDMDLSEFLVQELERPPEQAGCCCGGGDD